MMLARRIGIAIGSFVIAYFAVYLAANLIFGSGNVLVLVLAAVVGAGVYLEIWRRDRRDGQSKQDAMRRKSKPDHHESAGRA